MYCALRLVCVHVCVSVWHGVSSDARSSAVSRLVSSLPDPSLHYGKVNHVLLSDHHVRLCDTV